MDNFFYNLNDKLNAIRATPEVTHKQLNERDMSRAAKGYEKYGKQGMEALAKAGREGKALDPIRKKYNKYDNKEVDEGVMDTVKSVGKKVASGINKLVGHGSDEDMIKDLQRRSGAPVTGKKPTPPQQVKEKLSPAKQKSFAALAPPKDKITFADKIAGAKKEVDEMLGDVAADAMRKAIGKSSEERARQSDDDFVNKHADQARTQRRLDAEKKWARSKGRNPDAEMDESNAFDYKSPRKDAPRVGSVERGHKHDIKHTATGRVVTRRVDDQGNSVGADDDTDADTTPRGRGRPKGTKNVSSKAKVFQRKSKLMTKEGEDDPAEKGEYDREGDMALDDIDTIESAANELQSIIDADDNLPEWVQSKINKAMDYLDTARDYMAAQGNDQEPIAEKAVSKQQQKFMGMAHAMQKGEKIKGASKELKKVARTMKPKDTEDFAKTKHKGLPDKVKSKKKEESVEESDTAAAPKSSGMSFGKGIYDSMNRELEQMIAESMSINMSDSTEGNKSLTVTATDEDAMKLAMMLKSAGIGGQGGNMHSHSEQPCPTCGMPDCGCGDVQEAVDENAPDWPTNTETSDDALQYAGGLNKPKTDVAGDGQTTIPNTAVHTQDEDALRRMMEMAGLAQAELEPWKETMKEEEDFFHNPNVPADKQLPAPPKEVELDEEEEDSVDESIQRMREMAGIKEAKKEVDEEKTEEGNLFTGNLAKARADGKKEADLDGDGDMEKVRESIFALTNQWKAYKG